jgi:hypothetical protein
MVPFFIKNWKIITILTVVIILFFAFKGKLMALINRPDKVKPNADESQVPYARRVYLNALASAIRQSSGVLTGADSKLDLFKQASELDNTELKYLYNHYNELYQIQDGQNLKQFVDSFFILVFPWQTDYQQILVNKLDNLTLS